MPQPLKYGEVYKDECELHCFRMLQSENTSNGEVFYNISFDRRPHLLSENDIVLLVG